jgi:hypothetical protein
MVLDHLVIQRLSNKSLSTQARTNIFDKNELAAILKFGVCLFRFFVTHQIQKRNYKFQF